MKTNQEPVYPLLFELIRMRVAYTLFFIALQWIISINYHESLLSLAGIAIMMLTGLILIKAPLNMSLVLKERFMSLLIPIFFAIGLAIIQIGQTTVFKGLYLISCSLFLIMTMPRNIYRFLTPVLFFAAIVFIDLVFGQALYKEWQLVGLLIVDILAATLISLLFMRIDVAAIEKQIQREKFIENLLGSSMSKLLLQGAEGKLDGRSANGFLLKFDVRGFSNLVRHFEEEDFLAFIREYYKIVSYAVGRHGGVIHRTAGDSHIVCFGIYSNETLARQDLFNKAIECFDEITREAALLGQRLALTEKILIGGALDYGELKIQIFGHTDYHREVDLLGPVLVRCARLEAYTKTILSTLLRPRSILLLSPDALHFAENVDAFEVYQVDDRPVRDFGHLRWLAYKTFDIEAPGDNRAASVANS